MPFRCSAALATPTPALRVKFLGAGLFNFVG